MLATRVTIILLAITSLGVIATANNVHAQSSGLVCIADVSTTICPSTPVVLTSTIGTTFTVAINIQASASFNAFDITVKVDPTVLQPISDDLTGTVLGSNIITVANCIDPTGNGCGVLAGPGTVRMAVAELGAATPSPTTGRLFSITYNVTATATNIKVGFTTGCTNTSSQLGYCVTIAYGGTLVPETVQESTGNIGDFSLAVSPPILLIARAEVSGPFQLFFYSLKGFSGTITFTWAITPLHRNGPMVVQLSSNIVLLSPGTFTDERFAAITGRVTAPGDYTLTFTATAGVLTHTIQMTIQVVH